MVMIEFFIKEHLIEYLFSMDPTRDVRSLANARASVLMVRNSSLLNQQGLMVTDLQRNVSLTIRDSIIYKLTHNNSSKKIHNSSTKVLSYSLWNYLEL